ncbi:MAG: zf-HC2 domain-containing protein [Syntrophobacterales bacterium]|nr:MAG: zf-HC2 domain-containing protein [Syntrophobacterales bacterium]
MKCREVQDQLIEFYEGQLDQRDAEQIRDHLGMCSRCREELSSLEKVIGGLKSQRLPDPGAAFWRDFPKRVRKAFYEERRPIQVPIIQRVWEGIYGTPQWFSFSKPVSAGVSVAAIVLIIAGLLFFKAGWFWTGSRGIGEETLEEYFGGIGAVVSPFTPGSLEELSLYQLDDISKRLVGGFDDMGSSGEEVLKGDRFLLQEDAFAQLEGLNSEELDFVYDILKTRYLKSTTSLSMSKA